MFYLSVLDLDMYLPTTLFFSSFLKVFVLHSRKALQLIKFLSLENFLKKMEEGVLCQKTN